MSCKDRNCSIGSDHHTHQEAARFGEVCEHGSLKRQCLTCELQAQLHAADALAAVVRERGGMEILGIESALAAYEKARSPVKPEHGPMSDCRCAACGEW